MQEEMERKILEDIVQVYRFLESQNQAVNALYNAMDCGEISEMLHNVFKEIPDNTETRFACVDRVIGLKEGGLLTILQKSSFSYAFAQTSAKSYAVV